MQMQTYRGGEEGEAEASIWGKRKRRHPLVAASCREVFVAARITDPPLPMLVVEITEIMLMRQPGCAVG